MHTVLAGPPHSDSHSSGIRHFLQSSYLVSWMGKGIRGSDVLTQRLWWAVLLVSQTSTGVGSQCSGKSTPKCMRSACPEHRACRAEVLSTDTETPRASQSTQPSPPEAPPGEGTLHLSQTLQPKLLNVRCPCHRGTCFNQWLRLAEHCQDTKSPGCKSNSTPSFKHL